MAKFRHQHGIAIEQRNWMFIACHCLAPLKSKHGLDIEHLRKFMGWCDVGFDDDTAVETIHRVCNYRHAHPTFRNPSSQKAGQFISLTAVERRACFVTTMEAIDEPKAQRKRRLAQEKRERDRERQRRKRRAAGTGTLAQYLASFSASAIRARPWEAIGVSRATWYRRKLRQGVSLCLSTNLNAKATHSVSPSGLDRISSPSMATKKSSQLAPLRAVPGREVRDALTEIGNGRSANPLS